MPILRLNMSTSRLDTAAPACLRRVGLLRWRADDPNPHDALFKAVLGQPAHAPGMLRAVVPPVLAEALDWQTLTLRLGSLVEAALRHQHTDLQIINN